MKLSKKLYLHYFNFLRPLTAVVILTALALFMPNFVPTISAKTNIPSNYIYIAFALYAIYVLFKSLFGIANLLVLKNIPNTRLCYGLFKNPKPQHRIENPLEEYSLLALALYEAKNALIEDKKSLEELKKNKNFIPSHKFDKDGDNHSSTQYLNSLEAMHHLNKKDAKPRLQYPLESSWGIHDHNSAMQIINHFLEKLPILNVALDDTPENTPILEQANYQKYITLLEELDFPKPEQNNTNDYGFDLVRLIWVARSSFTLGYINEETLRSILTATGIFLARYYKTWHELAYSYLCTFCHWAFQDKNIYKNGFYDELQKRIHCAKLLLNDNESPWHNKPLHDLKTYYLKEIAPELPENQ